MMGTNFGQKKGKRCGLTDKLISFPQSVELATTGPTCPNTLLHCAFFVASFHGFFIQITNSFPLFHRRLIRWSHQRHFSRQNNQKRCHISIDF
jgi:hypothetical protein